MAEKIVDFETYCPKCSNSKTKETEEPCNACLNEPVNEDSRKPTGFQEE